MIKKIFNWSLCLAIGGLSIVSCQKDVEQAEVDSATNQSVSALDYDYSAFADNPSTRGCRVVTPYSGVTPRGAAITELLWEAGQTVTVSFIGGSDFVRDKVMEYAVQWEEHANLNFEFVENDGMIRVSFVDGAGSYSYVGTGALNRPANVETMNFGWFDDTTPDEEFSRTVLHEFGHALGLIHEHQHPNADLNWNEALVYLLYSAPPTNWSREDIDNNILGRFDPEILTYNDYDVTSIMHYPFFGIFFTDFQGTPDNIVLSDGDKEIAGILYPF